MALETGTYVSDLVATNPTSGDPVSQADDHLRLLKSTLQATFPDASAPIYGHRSGVAQSATGTSVDFTSIPSWVKQIRVIFSGVSTNGTSQPMVQIGDSGGIETSGYSGGSTGSAATNTVTGTSFTTGFGLQSQDAAAGIHGVMTICLISGSAWVASGQFSYSTAATIACAGSKTLSGTLDRIRITTVNGTDAFDGGTFNVIYD